MQNIDAIVRWPIGVGLLLSIAIHAAVLNSRNLYTPPIPHMATGRTVVQLTLLPSMDRMASVAAPDEATLHQETISTATEVTQQTAPAESIEQMAAPIDNKGVIAEAVATGTFHPAYPRISKRRGEEGTILLSVQVLRNGSAGQVEMLQSSGFRRLDEAAVNAALQTTFTPAVRLGHPVESITRLSYTFRLTDD